VQCVTVAHDGWPHALRELLDDSGAERRETLGSPSVLASWLAGHELLSADASLDGTDYRHARDGLQDLVAQDLVAQDLVAGAATASLKHLNEAAGEITYRVAFQHGTGHRLPVGDGWPLVSARLVEIVLEATTTKQWRRLKVCPGCRRHFFDDSPSITGKWCPGKRCLSRTTSERYRKRYKGGWAPR
jgi:predicted RNA-binding Zn ribbon-like protein